jgi:BirA family biotin operon repressor/biotin-[acetyl-CoA-carboxylase] ligase
VNQKNFSEDLADRVTSLSLECGREFERNDIFHKIMMSLELLYTDVKKGNFESTLREWKIRATMFDRQITLTQGDVEIQGRTLSLAADGGLVLETTKGRQVFYAGDVTITRQD